MVNDPPCYVHHRLMLVRLISPAPRFCTSASAYIEHDADAEPGEDGRGARPSPAPAPAPLLPPHSRLVQTLDFSHNSLAHYIH